MSKVFRPRTFVSHYYEKGMPIDKWARIGRACTLETALRAAVYKLLVEPRFVHVDVYNIDGTRVAAINRRGRNFTIVCV